MRCKNLEDWMRIPYLAGVLALPLLLMATTFLVSCKQSADAFFSGRPSEMSLVHNQIIGGPPESMRVLLVVPTRFPDANEAHIANWQESVIAWWQHPEKNQLMRATFAKLSRNELQTLKVWVRVRDKHRSKEKAQVLTHIETALDGVPIPQ
jgi:hypothetical protein